MISADSHGDGGAPLASFLVVEEVDGAVLPGGSAGGEGLGVGVVGAGVDGEKRKSSAGAAVDFDAGAVERSPLPRDADFVGSGAGAAQVGLGGVDVGGGGVFADGVAEVLEKGDFAFFVPGEVVALGHKVLVHSWLRWLGLVGGHGRDVLGWR